MLAFLKRNRIAALFLVLNAIGIPLTVKFVMRKAADAQHWKQTADLSIRLNVAIRPLNENRVVLKELIIAFPKQAEGKDGKLDQGYLATVAKSVNKSEGLYAEATKALDRIEKEGQENGISQESVLVSTLSSGRLVSKLYLDQVTQLKSTLIIAESVSKVESLSGKLLESQAAVKLSGRALLDLPNNIPLPKDLMDQIQKQFQIANALDKEVKAATEQMKKNSDLLTADENKKFSMMSEDLQEAAKRLLLDIRTLKLIADGRQDLAPKA